MPAHRHLDQELLAGLRCEINRLLAINLSALGGDRDEIGQIRAAVNDARRNVVRLDLDTLLRRRLTDPERQSAHRALGRLEAQGVVSLLREGWARSRVTHLQLCGVADE